MKPALYLLDVYAIIYRSYFAFINRPLRNSSGENVSAVYGFFKFLFALFDQRKPEAFAAVFDSKGKTIRHQMYEAYKATRQKTPEDLIAQVPLVEEILQALGVPMLRKEGYEADDVIATLAARCREDDRTCYIISGDKDLLQLVGGSVKALRPAENFSFKLLGHDDVIEEWGVSPVQILDYLSLTGDASDNVPGVKGIGDKTAVKLITQFGSLDSIYANLESVTPESLKKKLIEGRESAYLSRKLITLETSLDLGLESLDALHLSALNRAQASPLFLAQGMKSFAASEPALSLEPAPKEPAPEEQANTASAPREPSQARASAHSSGFLFDEAKPSEASAGAPAAETARAGAESLRGFISQPAAGSDADTPQESGLSGPGVYAAITDEAGLSRLVDDCISKGCFAFDTETDSLDIMEAGPVGFSLCHEPKHSFYIPLVSPDSPVIARESALRQLERLFSSRATLVAHNAKFDLHVMRRFGIRIENPIFDTMIAAWVLDAESNAFSLGSLSERILGTSGLQYEDVVPKGKTFSSVPIQEAVRYAAEDADFTLRLHQYLDGELKRSDLSKVFYDIEMPLIKILTDMEERGISVDAKALRQFGAELETELARIEQEVWQLVGHEFNLASTKQLQDVLFVERKLPVQKKTKTGYSTDTSVLEELAPLDPVPRLILRNRMLSKLKSTYVDTLADLAEKHGRIHTSYVQTGAATGRLSSRDPNLQNIPIREEEGRKIRSAFTASPGNLLISADYSQIELVVMAHLSGDSNLMQAFRDGVDIHRRTAAFIFGIPEEEVTPEHRRIAKTINFGVIYGMSAFRLARDLGIPNARAQAFINSYFSTYSGVAAFIRDVITETEKTGYASTLFGRRRKIPAINSRNKTEQMAAQRVAVNTPIQGTAADIVKIAMIQIQRELDNHLPDVRMLLQVHDELVFECPEGIVSEAEKLVKDVMEHAVTLRVPLRVSVETAFSWGDMH